MLTVWSQCSSGRRCWLSVTLTPRLGRRCGRGRSVQTDLIDWTLAINLCPLRSTVFSTFPIPHALNPQPYVPPTPPFPPPPPSIYQSILSLCSSPSLTLHLLPFVLLLSLMFPPFTPLLSCYHTGTVLISNYCLPYQSGANVTNNCPKIASLLSRSSVPDSSSKADSSRQQGRKPASLTVDRIELPAAYSCRIDTHPDC